MWRSLHSPKLWSRVWWTNKWDLDFPLGREESECILNTRKKKWTKYLSIKRRTVVLTSSALQIFLGVLFFVCLFPGKWKDCSSLAPWRYWPCHLLWSIECDQKWCACLLGRSVKNSGCNPTAHSHSHCWATGDTTGGGSCSSNLFSRVRTL